MNPMGKTSIARVVVGCVLAVCYWTAIVPLGLLLRLMGVDLMRRRLERGPGKTTYRSEMRQGPGSWNSNGTGGVEGQREIQGEIQE